MEAKQIQTKMKEYLTAVEFAKLKGVQFSTVYRAIEAGRLQPEPIYIGKSKTPYISPKSVILRTKPE